MSERFSRSELILGCEGMSKLSSARVAVFGAGGVGGYVIEALARSGVGTIGIFDGDTISPSNINRQIIALENTVGSYKTDAFEERIKSIAPETKVIKYRHFYLPGDRGGFDFSEWDYIVDAIDTVSAKLDIVVQALNSGTKIISSMGCGNRMDPSKLKVTDIFKTDTDPLAKVMRKELKKRGVKKLNVVCSTEAPIKPLHNALSGENVSAAPSHSKRETPGSVAFVPSAAGLLIASVVVRELSGFDPTGRTKGGKQ